MRISDWSSDVCSSDLLDGAVPDRRAGGRLFRYRLFSDASGSGRGSASQSRAGVHRVGAGAVQSVDCRCAAVGDPGGDHEYPELPVAGVFECADRGDRKSVVSGKSVSVRVDTGGRRIIKKKTKYIYNFTKV